ncbi:type IV toxin-antitoxin system AbiEi family antitoxin domain-containing protein [Candidatus Desantisbacteria bacterium]|nr:type IV toxin-antitoxin system AbiEi family antitoxin domain-containing protein [Candidatus Desantisbacteria bacterium]
MKKTILSEKELSLIEEIIVRYGLVTTFEQIYGILEKQITRQSAKNLINKLTKNGWLVRIKKGTYAISSLESRGFLETHTFKVAQILVQDSYISFAAALQHHGMFDQMLKTVTSVSLKRYQTKEVQGTIYKFINTKSKLFFGWENTSIENSIVKIATSEKAMLDILQFSRDRYAVDLVAEILREHRKQIDFDRLNSFVEKYSRVVQRVIGFLFDNLSIDSGHLYHLTEMDNSSSYMTTGSKIFNAKWRLYYPEGFKVETE